VGSPPLVAGRGGMEFLFLTSMIAGRRMTPLFLDAPHTSKGAFDAAGAILHDMRVDHGCSDVFMTKQLLHRAQVVAGLKHMRCK
jgi:hypothetical protein